MADISIEDQIESADKMLATLRSFIIKSIKHGYGFSVSFHNKPGVEQSGPVSIKFMGQVFTVTTKFPFFFDGIDVMRPDSTPDAAAR